MNADSGFGCLLRSISRSQEVIAAATMYRTNCGRRRLYMSAADADAYDRGFAMWPHVPAVLIGPERDGWHDREQYDSDAREYEAARAEERASQ